jgi:hypothetical protein
MSIDFNTQTWREIKATIDARIETLKKELWDGPISRSEGLDTARRVRIDELKELLDTLTGVDK